MFNKVAFLVSLIVAIYSDMNLSFAELVEIYPKDLLAMTHEEYLHQITTSTWKDPNTWRTSYQNRPDGEQITRNENIDELIQGQARIVCKQTYCGTELCQELVDEKHEFRNTIGETAIWEPSPSGDGFVLTHRKSPAVPIGEYYFTFLKCSSKNSATHYSYELQNGVESKGEFEAIPTSEDVKVANHLTQKYLIYLSGADLHLDKPKSVQMGLANYLADRRSRRKGLTRDQLLTLVFSKSWKREEMPHESASHSATKDFTPSKDWLSGFGRVSKRSIDSPTAHEGLAAKFTDLRELPGRNLRRKVGGTHSRSIVYQYDLRDDLDEYPSFSDFPNFYFKMPSPLLCRVDEDPESYYTRVFSEVVAYRLSVYTGFNVVQETRLMVDAVRTLDGVKSHLGSARLAIEHDSGFHQNPPKSLERYLNHPQKWRPSVSRIRVIDYAANAGDRHADNMFYRPSTFEIQGIDYEGGLTGIPATLRTHPISGGRFPISYEDSYVNGGDSTIRQKLLNLTFPELKEVLQDVATDEEIENIWLRFHILKADAQL